MGHLLTVIVLVAALLSLACVLFTMAVRAWRDAYGPLRQPRPRPPDGRQIANRQAADAYAAHHPHLRRMRVVRRPRRDV